MSATASSRSPTPSPSWSRWWTTASRRARSPVSYSEDEKVQKFVSAYEEAYGEKPIQFAADAYDAVYAIYEAFQESGCTAADSAETICDALINVFNGGFTFEGGLTGDSMQWNKAGEVNKTPKVCEIKGGKYIEK